MTRRPAATNDDEGTLAAYLREIGRLPRITVEQERELGVRIQRDRDDTSLTRLVEANLLFVVSYAKRYRGFGVSFLDLIHEGNLGLIEAARRFDPSRNVKFISYAVWWVRESMMHVLADHTRAFSFPPKLFATLYSGSGDVSLSEPIGSGGERELEDTLARVRTPSVDEELVRQASCDELTAALRDLDIREREVMALRFGLEDDEPRTLQQIGDHLHVSRERVRQIESRAKDKLRRSVKLRSHLN